jgi:putative transposase
VPDYRRNRVTGAAYFFTVNLLDRDRPLLVEHIDLLRASVRRVRDLMPFHIDAWVMLPEHMHALRTLPEGDAAFQRRWHAIKMGFSKGLPTGEARSASRLIRGSAAFGSAAAGSTRSGTNGIMPRTWITSISTR